MGGSTVLVTHKLPASSGVQLEHVLVPEVTYSEYGKEGPPSCRSVERVLVLVHGQSRDRRCRPLPPRQAEGLALGCAPRRPARLGLQAEVIRRAGHRPGSGRPGGRRGVSPRPASSPTAWCGAPGCMPASPSTPEPQWSTPSAVRASSPPTSSTTWSPRARSTSASRVASSRCRASPSAATSRPASATRAPTTGTSTCPTSSRQPTGSRRSVGSAVSSSTSSASPHSRRPGCLDEDGSSARSRR